MDLTNAPTRPEVCTAREMALWIDYITEPLRARWAELAPALRKCVEDHPEISDPETAGVFAENIKMAAELVTDIAALHKDEKAPYWDHGKAWDFWKRDLTEQIDMVVDHMRATLQLFGMGDQSAPFPEPTSVRGQYGTTATVKMVWDFEIVNEALVPREYLVVDEAAVKKAMRQRDPKTGRPKQTIPGIEWVQKPQLAVS